MVLQHALDLVRRDAIAEGVDEVVLAPEEPDVAILVLAGVVAGQEPVGAKARGGLLRLVPVAEHEPRVVAPDAEHTLLARGHRTERRRIQELDGVAGLHEAGGARPERARPGLADVVGAFGHPESLVDLEPEAVAPRREHLVGEMLARAHAVAERRHVAPRRLRLLDDLAVDRRHADEDRRRVRGDEARPERGVARSLVHDRRVAAVERVHEAGAEHVGPVELARVEDPVACGAEVEPVAGRRLAAEQRPVGVQDALRIAARAGGVDEVGGVLGPRRVRSLAARDAGERRLEIADVDAHRPGRLARPDEERVRHMIETLDGVAHRVPARHVGDQHPRAGVRGEVHDLLRGE